MSEKDVEMRESAEHLEADPDQPAPRPPASPTVSSASIKRSHSPTTAPINVDKHDEGHSAVAVAPEPLTNGTDNAQFKSRSASAQAPPPDDNIISIPPAQNEASTSAIPPPSHPQKPKSTKPRKSRSPSPPPAPPPPLLTVRLELSLGGPDNYEVDIAGLALQTGQRNPTPPPIKRDTSDSEGEGEGEDSDDPKSKLKGKGQAGKRSRAAEYDLADPFIDDSELAIDDRTHFAQTKQQGFYVSSGEVALLKDNAKKPKSKRPLILSSAAAASIQPLAHAAPPSASIPGHAPPPSSHAVAPTSTAAPQPGTRESPIALLDDDDQKPSTQDGAGGQKRKLSPPTGPADGDSPKKRRKVQQLQPFHPDLEASIEAIKGAIAKESFEVKGKFPPGLKPKLQQLAMQAIVLDEYNDNFFARMPQLFPYNKFTMTKLIKRLVFAEHKKLLEDRQRELLAELQKLAGKGFEQAQSEWERNVQNFHERQARIDADLQAAKLKTGSVSAEPSVQGDDTGDSPAPGTAAKENKEPGKKYRLTEPMKNIFWQLYCLNNECSRLTNEKFQLEGSTESVSEQGKRKELYQDIIKAFPEGWMTTGNISRDISVMKKKMEYEQTRFDEMNSQ